MGRKHSSRDMSCTAGSAECGKRHLVPKLQSNLEVTKHFYIFKEKRRRILVSEQMVLLSYP